MDVYTFMLKQMTDEQKRQTYARVLEQLLIPVVTREIQLEKKANYRDVILDVLHIFGLKVGSFNHS